jgi:hypothetical protein
MSNEIISILSSDGDNSTIVGVDDTTVIELLSPLPVKSEAADDQRVTSQINNRLSYCRTSRLNHTNMIDIIEAQLGRFVVKGDEGDCQPFIYLCDKDSQGR